jgi:basic membrane lipoprotein Med (substrate-binding protein (PBP1-ABC) superfamily)
MKLMDASVYDATEQLLSGTFSGGTYVGTLENDGVGLGTPTLPSRLSCSLKWKPCAIRSSKVIISQAVIAGSSAITAND